MYYEFLTKRFVANQVPDTSSFCIKGRNLWVGESHNPDWYCELVRKYPKSRGKSWGWKNRATTKLIQKDSVVKRGDIERVLLRLISGKTSCSKYVADLFLEAEKRYLSGRSPTTEAENIFWEVFGILLLDPVVIESINNIPMDLWGAVASYYEENKIFPEWLFAKEKLPF